MRTQSQNTDIAVDGARIAGTLLAPGSTIPGVLFVHGWGGCQERDLGRAQQIAALGCICLTFDMRGHVRTEAMRQTVTREQNLADVVAAYDHLRMQPHVDPDSILVVGASYGGYRPRSSPRCARSNGSRCACRRCTGTRTGTCPSARCRARTWTPTAAACSTRTTTARCAP